MCNQHQDSAFISGERIRNDNETTGGQVWSKPLVDGDLAIILYNSGNNDAVTVHVDWEELGWKSTDSVLVRDLWAREDLGSITSGYSAVLDAHDVAMLRLKRMLISRHY